MIPTRDVRVGDGGTHGVAILSVSVTRPVTTEIDVEDDLVLCKVLINHAVALIDGRGYAEFGDVGSQSRRAWRDAASREEPYLNVVRSPFHGIHT